MQDRDTQALAAGPVLVYEVSNGGALSRTDVLQPKINADLFDINVEGMRNASVLINEAKACYPLALLLQKLAEAACSELEDRLAGDLLASESGVVRRLIAAIRDNPEAGWKAWVNSLDVADLACCRRAVAKWLAAPINWHLSEWFPNDRGPRAAAMRDFEQMCEEVLEELGINLVYGDRPGSSYCAAELAGGIDQANELAAARGLGFRFVRAGEAVRTQRPTLPPTAGPEPRPDAEAELRAELESRFAPAFGLELSRSANAPTSCSPQVPMAHAAFHDAARFESWWDRVLRQLRDPARTFVSADGTRHVDVLGCGVYSIGTDGLAKARLWEGFDDGKPRLEVHDEVSFDPLPFGWLFLGRWQRGLVMELRHEMGQRGREVDNAALEAYCQWAVAAMRRRIQRHCDLRWVRARIRRAVALDAIALRVGRAMNLLLKRRWVGLSVYNGVVRNLEAHRKLERDAPQLAVLYQVLSRESDFPATGEPLYRLKVYLAGKGLGPRFWRLLVKAKARLLKPVAQYYRAPSPSAVVDYLCLLERMGWHREPPAMFMKTVLALRGQPNDRPAAYAPMLGRFMPALRRIVQAYERADETQHTVILESLHGVMQWLDVTDRSEIAGRKSVPPWSVLVKMANDWARAQDASATWSVPISEVTVGALNFRFIDSARGLLDEGRAMRHCAADYVGPCQRGDSIIASVRREHDGTRLATAGFARKDDRWHLVQLVGHCNAAVPAEIGVLAAEVAVLLPA